MGVPVTGKRAAILLASADAALTNTSC